MITPNPSSPPQSHYMKHMRSLKRHRDKKKLQKKDTRLTKKQSTPSSPDRGKWKKSSHLTPKRNIQREIDLSCLQMSKLSLDDQESTTPSRSVPVQAESPMVTPRLARSRSSTTRTNTADSVASALFNTLFSARRKGVQKTLFKDWDEGEDDDDDDAVDETWITNFLKDSVVASKAVDYALQAESGKDLLNGFVDEAFVYTVVNDLRFEDHRINSARLSIIKAIFRSCVNLRSCVAEAMIYASEQRLQRCQWVDAVAEDLELDSDDVALTELHPRVNCQRKIPPNAKQPAPVRDHSHLLIELIQFLLDELGTPTSSFFTASGADSSPQKHSLQTPDPTTARNGHRPPSAQTPLVKSRPQASSRRQSDADDDENAPIVGRQRARSETLEEEDYSAIRRRGRANTTIDLASERSPQPTVDQAKRTRSASISCSPTRASGPSKNRRVHETPETPETPAEQENVSTPVHSPPGAPAFGFYDNIMKTWRSCIWSIHQAIVNMLRTYGCRVGNPNGPDTGEINEIDGCIRRLVALAPYVGPYLCRGFLQAWPTGIACREVAFIRLLETTLSTVPCVLSKEVLAAHATSMGLPTVSTNNLPLRAASRCVWKVGECLNSKHFRISQQAIACIKHPVIVAQVLVPNRPLLEKVTNSLHQNRNHWHPVVREQSDAAFDALLDYL